MSAIELQEGAPTQATPARESYGLREAVFMAAFLLVWVSTAPFKALYEYNSDAPETTANLINQVSFSLVAVLALLCAASAGGRAALAYARPIWIAFMLWMTVGVVQSNNPDASMRAFKFLLVVMTMAGGALLLPRGRRHFAFLLAAVALIVMLICYVGLVVFPEAAIHSAGDLLEPGHAGDWRGLFDHKNIAGAMMAIFVLIGIFVATSGAPRLGVAIAVLAAVFLFFTGSKTSMALGPLVLLIGLACARIGSLWLRALVALGPLALLLTATVGSVMSPTVKRLLDMVSPDQTFTGRTEIWSFALDRLGNRPILGYGLEGFWLSPYVLFSDVAEDETGLALGMVHGHNGYVDLAMAFGIPGLVLGVIVLVLLPLRDHHRVIKTPENKALAELFFRIWLFCAYSACLESFFFRRADPVWFALLISVLGLRLTSKYRVDA